jgi:hypothetical protein
MALSVLGFDRRLNLSAIGHVRSMGGAGKGEHSKPEKYFSAHSEC